MQEAPGSHLPACSCNTAAKPQATGCQTDRWCQAVQQTLWAVCENACQDAGHKAVEGFEDEEKTKHQ